MAPGGIAPGGRKNGAAGIPGGGPAMGGRGGIPCIGIGRGIPGCALIGIPGIGAIGRGIPGATPGDMGAPRGGIA